MERESKKLWLLRAGLVVVFVVVFAVASFVSLFAGVLVISIIESLGLATPTESEANWFARGFGLCAGLVAAVIVVREMADW